MFEVDVVEDDGTVATFDAGLEQAAASPLSITTVAAPAAADRIVPRTLAIAADVTARNQVACARPAAFRRVPFRRVHVADLRVAARQASPGRCRRFAHWAHRRCCGHARRSPQPTRVGFLGGRAAAEDLPERGACPGDRAQRAADAFRIDRRAPLHAPYRRATRHRRPDRHRHRRRAHHRPGHRLRRRKRGVAHHHGRPGRAWAVPAPAHPSSRAVVRSRGPKSPERSMQGPNMPSSPSSGRCTPPTLPSDCDSFHWIDVASWPS